MPNAARDQSQMPTTPVLHLEECVAAISAFRIVGARKSLIAVSDEDAPALVMSRERLPWSSLADDEVRLLLRVDGVTTIRAMAGDAGMHMDTACLTIGDLAERGVVALQ